MLTSTRRSVLIVVIGLTGVIGVCGMMLDRFYRDPSFLKPHDFLQYWSAGRLLASGGNPYDADQVVELQRGAVRDEDRPTFMWNPPWVLALVTPFGLLPMRTGQLAWLAIQVLATLWASDTLWRLYCGNVKYRPAVWAGTMIFYPLMYLIFLGQSGGWLLLGLTGFLVAAVRGPRPLAVLAAMVAVKPHLFIPFWICYGLTATRSRTAASLLGWGVLSGLAAILIVWIQSPEIWSEYFAAITRPETDAHRPLAGWQHPLIGYRLRLLIDPSAFWVQMVPTAVVAILTPAYWWFRRANWDWRTELPRLLFAGLIAAPYGAWEHDQLVLLIPIMSGIITLLHRGTRLQFLIGLASLMAINATALSLRESQQFIWIPPALLVWYGWVQLSNPAAPSTDPRQQLSLELDHSGTPGK